MNEMKIKRGTDVVAIGGEAAVLAKELAAVKRTPSPAASPSVKPRWSSSNQEIVEFNFTIGTSSEIHPAGRKTRRFSNEFFIHYGLYRIYNRISFNPIPFSVYLTISLKVKKYRRLSGSGNDPVFLLKTHWFNLKRNRNFYFGERADFVSKEKGR